jgi:hypothetical protein
MLYFSPKCLSCYESSDVHVISYTDEASACAVGEEHVPGSTRPQDHAPGLMTASKANGGMRGRPESRWGRERPVDKPGGSMQPAEKPRAVEVHVPGGKAQRSAVGEGT